MLLSIQPRGPRLIKNLSEDHVLRKLITTSLEEQKIQSTCFDFVKLSKPFYPNDGDIQVPHIRNKYGRGPYFVSFRNVACSEVCIYMNC